MPAPALLPFQVMQPESTVLRTEVFSLIAAVTVHAVRINHEIEFLACLLESVYELQGILEMYIVISCTVGQLQHDRFCMVWSRLL